MGKQFKFDEEARQKVLEGAEIVAKAVGSTLGPRGRLVLLGNGQGTPRPTKDGISVARSSVPLADPFQNMGATMMVESSAKTLSDCGDGTTTSCILANRIVSEGAKLVAASYNPVDVKNGIDWAVEKVVEELKSMSRPVVDAKEIEQVAVVSSNGDSTIGELISRAMSAVGNNGVITVSDGKTLKTDIDIVNGYRFGRGYLSSHFSTNEKMECILENPLVLIHDKCIANVNIMLPILKKCHDEFPNRPLFLCCETEGESLATLLVNHLKGAFKSCSVKNPGYGDRKAELLEDIATLTGATVVNEMIGHRLENFDTAWLGSAKRVVVTKNSTTIIEGGGAKEALEKRVEEIRNTITNCADEWDRERQEERLAALVGGVAEIKIGGATESEVSEKKDRVEDALSATKSAVEEGIVAGGGVALLRASTVLDRIEIPPELRAGVEIVRKAAQEPLYRIVGNCSDGKVGLWKRLGIRISKKLGLRVKTKADDVRLKILANDNNNFGFNARTEEFQDLVASGIIDPTKVVRCALLNAASVAGLILTTSCLICEEPDLKVQ